ncbi:trichohyalin [Haplochromis burtoni]|uniref:trichohyalin n=1 Tax=Haplochromis burtoni TaxID=8153 RepID=UPI0003BD0538|nr:trichohyalin [Haplochromis burtoni]
MSDSIRRRSSSRQLLQNLIRVTAQRSQEDAEEIERERRRRAREKQRGEKSPSWLEPTQQNHYTQNTESDEELKPSCSVGLDEDEGFSDWSHRLETRNEQEMQNGCRAKEQRPSASPPNPQSDQHQVDEEGQEEAGGLEPRSRTQDTSTEAPVKTSNDKKEVRTSYSSSVFLAHDTRLQHTTCRPADMTSYLAAGTMKPRYAPYSLEEACRVKGEVEVQKEQEEKNENNKHEQEREEEEVQPTLQKERRPTESRQTPRDDEQEEEVDFTHEVKEDLHHIRVWRHRDDKNEAREDNEEERTLQNKRLTDSRDQWSELENRSSAISLCNSSEGEESLNCYGPMSPTFKVTCKTEGDL